jgi:hypothetical protein
VNNALALALAYLQSAKINQEEQNFKQKFAEKYKLRWFWLRFDIC